MRVRVCVCVCVCACMYVCVRARVCVLQFSHYRSFHVIDANRNSNIQVKPGATEKIQVEDVTTNIVAKRKAAADELVGGEAADEVVNRQAMDEIVGAAVVAVGDEEVDLMVNDEVVEGSVTAFLDNLVVEGAAAVDEIIEEVMATLYYTILKQFTLLLTAGGEGARVGDFGRCLRGFGNCDSRRNCRSDQILPHLRSTK